eukprot:scaffold34019_cov60-Attheya_sp.AAC.3
MVKPFPSPALVLIWNTPVGYGRGPPWEVCLFKYCTDYCSTILLAILTTYLLGGGYYDTVVYGSGLSTGVVCQALECLPPECKLVLLFTGPGEVIMSIIIILAVPATLGLDWFIHLYDVTFHHQFVGLAEKHDVNIRDDHLEPISDPVALGPGIVLTFYYCMYATAVVKILLLKKPHGWSRFGLLTSLLMRLVPTILLHFGMEFDLTE